MTRQRRRPARRRATVELSDPDGDRVFETAEGDGPVDALFARAGRGHRRATWSWRATRCTASAIGADARGEANLSVRFDGEEYDGTGTSKRHHRSQRAGLAGRGQPRCCARATGRSASRKWPTRDRKPLMPLQFRPPFDERSGSDSLSAGMTPKRVDPMQTTA